MIKTLYCYFMIFTVQKFQLSKQKYLAYKCKLKYTIKFKKVNIHKQKLIYIIPYYFYILLDICLFLFILYIVTYIYIFELRLASFKQSSKIFKSDYYLKGYKNIMIPEVPLQQVWQDLKRPINCLADDDRSKRKGGLDQIKKSIKNMSKDNVLKLFNQTKLVAMLIKIASDKIQNIREAGLEIFDLLIKIGGADGKNIYEQLLPSLISRVNQTPFPEKSQQLRLKVLNIFIKLIPYKDCFFKNLPQIGSAIAKCLADAYDEIKYVACDLTNKLSQGLPHQIGKYSLNIILSLRDNLKHQKFKVRKTSLQTIGHILITDGAGGNFQQIRVALKSALIDKKQQVRSSGYRCVANLLLYLGPKYMKQYESHLIGFLLVGLDDQSANIIKQVMDLLQKCGKKLKQQDEDHTMIDDQASQQISV